MIEHLGRHTLARVSDHDADIGAGGEVHRQRIVRVQLHIPGRNSELASVRHRIAGVDEQVHQDLLDLPWVRLDGPEPLGELIGQNNILADQPPHQRAHLIDQLIQVQDLGSDRLPAGEGQQLTDEPARPVGGP